MAYSLFFMDENTTVIEKKEERSQEGVEGLFEEIEGLSKVEEKLRHVFDFMRKALDHKPNAHLGLFWKARSVSLTLFKETLTPTVRSKLWNEYLALMQDARAVKEFLD